MMGKIVPGTKIIKIMMGTYKIMMGKNLEGDLGVIFAKFEMDTCKI
jgi:hypothetical protein